MAKSTGNIYTVEDVGKKNFDPMALRYLYLTAHYRDPLNFTWDSLESAQNALNKLKEQLPVLREETERTALSHEKNEKVEEFRKRFLSVVFDDLNTSKALAVLWEMLKSNIPGRDKYDLALYFDEGLGLGLAKLPIVSYQIPAEITQLAKKREELRKEEKFEEADKIRIEIEKKGYKVEDTEESPRVKPVQNEKA